VNAGFGRTMHSLYHSAFTAYRTRLLLAATAFPLSLHAQGIDKIGASDIKLAAQQSTFNDAKGVAFRVSNDGQAQYILNRRTEPNAVEMHCDKGFEGPWTTRISRASVAFAGAVLRHPDPRGARAMSL
jgi:hypothetical protein